jgi:flagellar protein FlaG
MTMDSLQALMGSVSGLPRRELADASRRDAVPTEIQPAANSAASTSPQVVASMAEAAGSGAGRRGGETNQEQSREEVEEAVKGINDFFQSVKTSLQFTMDEESERMVVQIKDPDGKVVKQIPSERALELARRLDEVRGLLLEEQA